MSGVGGNLVAVQASRLSTALHKVSVPGVSPVNAVQGCPNPCTTFFGKGMQWQLQLFGGVLVVRRILCSSAFMSFCFIVCFISLVSLEFFFISVSCVKRLKK